MEKKAYITDPEILGGTPVFCGTRVPVRILFEYLEDGDSLSAFLDAYPSVSREDAVELLQQIRANFTVDEAAA